VEVPMLAVRRYPIAFLYLAFAMTVLAVSRVVVETAAFEAHCDLLALAMTIDMVVLVPLAYLVLAAMRGWPSRWRSRTGSQPCCSRLGPRPITSRRMVTVLRSVERG
jgi:membrane protein implicated in regulation of membrane protease activity